MRLQLLAHEAFALIPGDGARVVRGGAQPHRLRHRFARESEQRLADSLALMRGRDEELVEMIVGAPEGEHGGDVAVGFGDIKRPAIGDLARNARAQIVEGCVARSAETGRFPACHPHARDRVERVFTGRTDRDSVAHAS